MTGGVLGTVLGSVLGFLASLLPEIFGLIQARMANKPVGPQPPGTMYPLPQGMGPGTSGTNGTVTDGTVSPDGEDYVFLPDDPRSEVPIHYVMLDILRASVRPVLTYAFFGTFVYIKLVTMAYALMYDHTKAIEVLPILWDEGTEALFAAVLSFWFGSRAMARIRRK